MTGSIQSQQYGQLVNCQLAQDQVLQNQLELFWHIEKLRTTIHLSPDEKLCEEHFEKTTKRSEDDAFIVQIPFKKTPSILGESKNEAKKRLL